MEYDDLIRGEGEWRNMQEIIRKTFRVTFEKISRQQEQILQLNQSLIALKTQTTAMPTGQELNDIILSKVRSLPKDISRNEIDDIRQQLADLRADVQRRPSMRYIDDSLRRKLDKTDAMVKNLQTLNGLGEYSDIAKASLEISELRQKFEQLTNSVKNLSEDSRLASKASDVYIVKELVEELYKMMGDCVTSVALDDKLARKV